MAVFVLIAAAVTALLLKNKSDDDDRRAAREAAASSSSAAASSSSAAAEASASAKAAADEAERSRRQELVVSLQDSILKDAKKDVESGLLSGPIKRVECEPVSGGSSDLLTDTTGAFSCIAVTKTSSDGSYSGYKYSSTINWTKSSYMWQLS